MKIAMITGSAGNHRCGVGDYTWWLAQFLAIDAHVDLYYARGHAPVAPPYPRLTKLELKPVNGFSVISMAGFASKLTKAGYDIIHIQYPSKGFGTSVGPGMLFQRLSGMQSRSRLVLTLHEWTTSHPLRKALMEQMLVETDGLILTTEYETSVLVNRFKRNPIHVLPVGNVLRAPAQIEAIWREFDGEPASAPPEDAGPEGRNQFGIFHYGLPAKGKGFDRLLGALKIVREAGIEAVLHFHGDMQAGSKLEEEFLALVTQHGVADCVERHPHIPQDQLEQVATNYIIGVFPFDEGFSSKRSSIASISHLELPIVVGGGSRESHPYYAPEENSAASLAVLLVELLKGRLVREWELQIRQQREYAARFSFPRIAVGHLEYYRQLRKSDA